MKKHLILFFLSICFFSNALTVPFLSGRINDYAGILSSTVKANIENSLREHEEETSNQVVILTVLSTEEESIESFSIKVAESWKIGQKGKDNGVLLVVALNDRKVRIEVGYGLEGTLTDYICSLIIRNDIIPHFKIANYEKGIEEGTLSIIKAIEGTYKPEINDSIKTDTKMPIVMRIIMGLFVYSIISIFTFVGLFSKGAMGWFLYIFLIPFWFAFSIPIFGFNPAVVIIIIYLIIYPVFKIIFHLFLRNTDFYSKFVITSNSSSVCNSNYSYSDSSYSSNDYSSGSGFSSSGFSGGGGSFGGGGSSGSW